MTGFIRIGPTPYGTSASFEIEVDGKTTLLHLDAAHAAALAKRITECLDGTIKQRAPSRRVLEIEFGHEVPRKAAGGT